MPATVLLLLYMDFNLLCSRQKCMGWGQIKHKGGKRGSCSDSPVSQSCTSQSAAVRLLWRLEQCEQVPFSPPFSLMDLCGGTEVIFLRSVNTDLWSICTCWLSNGKCQMSCRCVNCVSRMEELMSNRMNLWTLWNISPGTLQALWRKGVCLSLPSQC